MLQLSDLRILADLQPSHPLGPSETLERDAPTAVILVKSFSGFGIHEVLSIHRLFPRAFRNFIFVSAAVVDSGSFNSC